MFKKINWKALTVGELLSGLIILAIVASIVVYESSSAIRSAKKVATKDSLKAMQEAVKDYANKNSYISGSTVVKLRFGEKEHGTAAGTTDYISHRKSTKGQAVTDATTAIPAWTFSDDFSTLRDMMVEKTLGPDTYGYQYFADTVGCQVANATNSTGEGFKKCFICSAGPNGQIETNHSQAAGETSLTVGGDDICKEVSSPI